MSAVIPGRHTADIEGDFVVFIIGMRVNHLWAVHKWLPVAAAMPKMQKALVQDPQSGYLAGENYFNPLTRTSCNIQYWRSFADLERFSKEPTQIHLEAWRAFNKAIGSNGMVGIWHETFQVKANQYECVYGNMPRFGLAKAGEHIDAVGVFKNARSRFTRPVTDNQKEDPTEEPTTRKTA